MKAFNGLPTALAVKNKTVSVRFRVKGHIFHSLSFKTQYYLTWRDMSTQTGIVSAFNSKSCELLCLSKDQYLPPYFKRLCDTYLKESNPWRLFPVEVMDVFFFFHSTTQEYDNVMYNTSLSSFCPIIWQLVAYERFKTKQNFKLLVLTKSGCGHLREVVAYKTFQI